MQGVPLGTVLFVVFLVLKLLNKITWSWWWVTSPLWISAVLTVVVLAVVATVAFLVHRFVRLPAREHADLFRMFSSL